MELKILNLENRIHKLTEKNASENARIIKKLTRKLRALKEEI